MRWCWRSAWACHCQGARDERGPAPPGRRSRRRQFPQSAGALAHCGACHHGLGDLATPHGPRGGGGVQCPVDGVGHQRAAGSARADPVFTGLVRGCAAAEQDPRAPVHAGHDRVVDFGVFALHLLALYRHHRLHPLDGCSPWLWAGAGRAVCLCGAAHRLLPDRLAAAAPPRAHADGCEHLAQRGCVHPHLQRALGSGAPDGVLGHESRLAQRPPACVCARRRPPHRVPRVLRRAGRGLPHPRQQPPCQGGQHQCGAPGHAFRVHRHL